MDIDNEKNKVEQLMKTMNEESKPLKFENDRLKSLIDKLETEKADVNALYERYHFNII